MSHPVLATKLFIPAAKPGLVARQRLVHRLNQGLQRASRLMLISAPAGYGKSTLIVEWIQGIDRGAGLPDARPVQFCWLTLDERDNDSGRFLRYFISALQTVDNTLGQEALDLLEIPGQPPYDACLAILVNELAVYPGSLAIVLDDYHTINTVPIHRWIDALLESLPPNIHLVITTRTDPLLHISRLRSRGQVTEIRSEDLRFSAEEAVTFLRETMGLTLDPQEEALLEAQTEGWAAGLQLAALSLEGACNPSERIRAFGAEDRYVMDYLVEEVLCCQPEEVQDFLLKTSVLDRFCLDLCEALLAMPQPHIASGSAAPIPILEYLERSNLFIQPLDAERRWYRYHSLFAELLRQRLIRQAGKAECSRLRLKASAWCEQNGLLAEAIDYAREAGERARVADLLEQYGIEIMQQTARGLPQGWLAALDEDARRRPMIAIVDAYSEYFDNPDPTGQLERKLDAIGEALAAEPDSHDAHGRPLGNLVLGYRFALRAAVGRIRGADPEEILALATEALRLLPEGAGLARFESWRALYTTYLLRGEAYLAEPYIAEAARAARANHDEYRFYSVIFSQAQLALSQGRLAEAERICQEALGERGVTAEKRSWRSMGAGALHLVLGSAAVERGDFGLAEEFIRDGLERIAYYHEMFLKMRSWAWLAWIHWYHREYDLAEEDFKRSRKTWPGADRYVDAQEIRLGLLRAEPRDFDQAVRWAAAQTLDLDDTKLMRSTLLEGEWHFVDQATLMRVLIARIRGAEAVDRTALAQALVIQQQVARECGWGARSLELTLLDALARQAVGDVEGSHLALQRALAQAEPEGYLRTFLDEGEPLRALLAEYRPLAAQTAKRSVLAYLDRLLASFPGPQAAIPAAAAAPAPAKRPDGGLVEPLSERELEVLRLIAEGLSNAEIARKLYLSPNTLKAHTQTIYGKLDVHSRVQAVNNARELGLLA
ncbi:MAG TPA: LuxR C-terminal-related transcriptional regulator [Anaerolineaceae bacterium]